ncbi:hypothetical protein L490_5254 [Bordetella bronchiseptica 00-P-2796]|uniref:Uncharacterized protein n=5 Tax=Bordetella bronchiseptica TaxID=518 RepID=A0ABR4RD69_BORBO|nr:hypothetical protein L490_5254 [Bordetella bronchiseptica 00-P-2796]
MNAQFGNEVAPGGAGLDLVSVSGTHHAAIRALDKKIDGIKRQLKKQKAGDDGETAEMGLADVLPPQLAGDLAGAALGLERI